MTKEKLSSPKDKTVPLETYDSPFIFYGVTYELKPSEINAVNKIQNTLIKQGLESLLLLPFDGSLHLTIANISPLIYKPMSWSRYNKFISENLETYRSILHHTSHSVRPFQVSFDLIEAFDKAIILRSRNPKLLNSLRGKLALLPRYPGTAKDPEIAHCTISRYKRQSDLSKVRTVLKGVEIKLTVSIDKISLVNGDRFFSRPHNTIAEFPLT